MRYSAAQSATRSRAVAAAVRTIFAQSDAEHVHAQLDVIAGMLGRWFPAVEAMLRAAEDELLAFTAFPVGHAEEAKKRSPTAAISPKAPWP